MDESFKGKIGPELEEIGAKIFKTIGLNCFAHLKQAQLNDITSGYSENEHLEFDYLIPENKVCLIGEITGGDDEGKIKQKYYKFLKKINIIKNIEFSEKLWEKLGITQENIKYFREINSIRGFFITTTKEKCDVTLSKVSEMAVFYKSDFSRIEEYSQRIGTWAKNYFCNNFCIDTTNDESLTIYERDNMLIRSTFKKITSKYTLLSDLYTFTISPYKLLDITHVYRLDELPSLQDSPYNYQRPLDYDKLKKIRENLLTDLDFMFPSNILVILSEECNYSKDGQGKNYLYIPKKYGSISVIDGQHRLFSYADEKVQDSVKDNSRIMVTAVKPKTYDQEIIRIFSANIFIEINSNQTRVEITHLDKIAYELGNEEPKVIATKIIATLNTRQNFSNFFNINSNQGIVEAGIIIEAIKKITNLPNIKKLENPRIDKTKNKKAGYETLFNATISELFEREALVEKGTILFERYFNEIFSVFKKDKPSGKNEPQTSFLLSKFWGGWVNLLIIFIEEGLDWSSVQNELNKIKDNVRELRQVDNDNTLFFKLDDPKIPDSSHSPTKVSKFLNENRQKATSIQDIS
jgi:DGQHR domain-containing protein